MITKTMNETARWVVIARHSVGVLEQWAYRDERDARSKGATMAAVQGVTRVECDFVRNYRGRKYTRVVL